MDIFEKVEKLREQTGVSFEEAKKALEANNYDLLEACLALEKEGKIAKPQEGYYSTGASQDMRNAQNFEMAQRQYQKSCDNSSFKESMRNFADFFRKVFKKSLEINFNIIKGGKTIVAIPLLFLLMLVLGFFWVTVPLIIIGLFCGITYNFSGVDAVVVDVNDVCDKASQTAENIKKEFKKEKEESDE